MTRVGLQLELLDMPLSPLIVLCLLTMVAIPTVTSSSSWGEWSAWGGCNGALEPSSLCDGKRGRTRQCLDADNAIVNDCAGSSNEYKACDADVNGGWSGWSSWGSCSVTCGPGQRERNRNCDNPSPCNAGKFCEGIDTDYRTCNEASVDGGWSTWGNWSSCSVTMGTGIQTRQRRCDDPPTCHGVPCYGEMNETRSCEVIPRCFSRYVLDPEYSSEDTPMQAYIYSKVDIYSTLIVSCTIKPRYHWILEKDNQTEILHKNPLVFHPKELGIYQLNLTAFGQTSDVFLNDIMYINVVYPPPNAFIVGGSGLMIGEGVYTVDAFTESYDLTKGRGSNENLEFQWHCIPLSISTLYDTLKVDVDPASLFAEDSNASFVGINHSFFEELSQANKWSKEDSFLMQYLKQVSNETEFCNKTNTLENHYVTLHNYLISNDSFKNALTSYMNNIKERISSHQGSLGIFTFSASVTDPKLINRTAVWIAEVDTFHTRLQLLYDKLNHLSLYAPINISEMCNTSNVGNFISDTKDISQLLEQINGTNTTYISVEDYAINSFVKKEILTWKCSNFTVVTQGIAEIKVIPDDVVNKRGFIFSVMVTANGSSSYFQQRAMVIKGNPPILEIECRLNCMKKTALSSVLSLYASCPSCDFSQALAMKYKWKLLFFNIDTKTTSEVPGWQNTTLSNPETASFVMKAFSLKKASYYIVEINSTRNLHSSISFMLLQTNIPPYGGKCKAIPSSNSSTGVSPLSLECKKWKDEGFRSSKDPSLDWKETLSYRVHARDRDGNLTLLYFGTERNQTVLIPEGDPFNNYRIDIVFFVYDIFQDYTEYRVTVNSYASIKTVDARSINSFLQMSDAQIDLSVQSGNSKMVSMSVENAATVVTRLDLPKSVITDDPSQWSSLGAASDNGSTTSWSEMWDNFLNPPLEDTKHSMSESTENYAAIIETVVQDNANQTDMLNAVHFAHSMGTVLNNKDLVSTITVENAVTSNNAVLNMFIAASNITKFPVFEDLQSTSEAILRLADNSLSGLLPPSSPEFPDTVDIYSIQTSLDLKAQLSVESDTSSLTSMEKAYLATQMTHQQLRRKNETLNEVKKNVPKILDSVETLGTVLSKMAHLKQLPVHVTHVGIKSSMEKKTLPELIKNDVVRENISMSFSQPANPDTDNNDVQITIFEKTPFNWDTESKHITSPTVAINIRRSGGNKRKLPVTVKFPNDVKNNTRTVYIAIPSDKTKSSSQVVYYKMYWQKPSEDITLRVMGDTVQMKCTVYLSVGRAPNRQEYDFIKSAVADADGFSASFQANICPSSCLLYFAALLETDASSGHSRLKRSTSSHSNVTSTQVQQYQIVAWTVGCRVWDTSRGKWDRNSCTMSSTSTLSETTCVCNNPPGTYFATTFYVPPNTIDFSSVFDKFDIINNGAVFGTVIALLCVYALLCIWALVQDRADKKRWSLSYLIDNNGTDQYLYMVTVYTGLDSHAGTNSRVSIAVTSNKRDTGVRRLQGQKHERFGVGSVRRFVMSVRKKLGDLKYLNVWHDNSGKGSAASWYLVKIVIDDLQTHKRFIFSCNQWLSVDDEDGMIQRILVVQDDGDMDKFGVKFQEKARNSIPENHMWLSVLIRPEDSNFTRVERLSCCLTFLFLAMISNAMFYETSRSSQQIVLGPLKFSLNSLYISLVSVIIGAVPLFLISFIFRKSSKNETKTDKTKVLPDVTKKENEINKKENNRMFMLPFWTIFIAWSLVVCAVFLSGFFLILYSMEWGKDKSEEWLLCFFVTFVESVFIADPLKIIVISIIFAYFSRNHLAYNSENIRREELLKEAKRNATENATDFTENELNDILNAKRNMLEPLENVIEPFPNKCSTVQDTPNTSRNPMSSFENLFTDFVDQFPIPRRPLSKEIVEKLKEERQKEINAKRVFLEVVYYAFFIMVLYLLSYSYRDNRSFWLHQHISQHILYSPASNVSMDSIRFHKIVTTGDFYRWNRETLLPFLFPTTSYNDENLLANERMHVRDQENLRVGPLRLRQLRSKSDRCSVPLMTFQTCYEDYSIPRESTTSHCIGWTDTPCDPNTITSPSYSAWRFTSSLDVWGTPSLGEYSLYGGGGYIADLGVNFDVSNYTLDELENNLWIDRKTRAVFIEFTLYNAGINLFAFVSLLIEYPDTGGVITSNFVRILRTYQHLGDFGMFIFVAEISFLICMVIFVIKMFQILFKKKFKFFKNLWQVLDFAVFVLTIVGLCMYIARYVFMEKTMSNFKRNKNMFVNFSHIAVWDEILGAFIGVIVFLVTIRLMRVLSYNHKVTQLASVLSHCSKDLLGCLIIFLIVYLAYASLGYLLFGKSLDNYRNIFIASITITNALIGRNSIDGLIATTPILAEFYYFTFVLFVVWIIMTMLNATLNQSISTVRRQSEELKIPYGIHDMAIKMFQQFVVMLRVGLHKTLYPRERKDEHLEIEDC